MTLSPRPFFLILLAFSLCNCSPSTTSAPGEEPSPSSAPAPPQPIPLRPPAAVEVPPGEEDEDGPASPVKAWHGMSLANLKESPPGTPGGSRCQVTHTYRGSPAEAAGIEAGDMIVSLDGAPVSRFQDVGGGLKGKAPESSHPLKVWRKGREVDVDLVLAQKPGNFPAWQREQWLGSSMIPFLGVSLPDGKPFDSKGVKARLWVLDFWATWCGPCKLAMPKLEALQEKYRSKGLRVIGISSEEEGVIKDFLSRRPLAYTVIRDPTSSIKQDYEVSKLPTLVVIDDKGIVLARATGSEGGVEQAEKWAAERLGGKR